MEFEYKPKLFTLANKKSALEVGHKTHHNPSIGRLQDLISGLSLFISTMQASLADDKSQLDNRKYTFDELKYFANEWTQQFKQEIQSILEQNDLKNRSTEKNGFLKLNADKLEDALRAKDHIKHFQLKVSGDPKRIYYTDKLNGSTLNMCVNVDSGPAPKNPCTGCRGFVLCTLYILGFSGLIGASYMLYERFCEEMQ